jgi:hypothetical protein
MSEAVSRRIRINNMSLFSAPPLELINVGYVTIDGAQQQFNGNFVLSKTELKKLNLGIGDEFILTIQPPRQ